MQIIPNDGKCKSGYTKCGIINNNNDYLCLKEDYGCPINSIIIKLNNETPGIDYKSYEFGNKFFFFSNKKTNNSLIIDFSISTDDKKIPNYENIDKDYYSNVLKYNPYINLDYMKKIPPIVYLNIEKFQIDFTYKDMIELQDKYDTRSKFYTKDIIEEMNSEVHKYKYLLILYIKHFIN